jgi:hypothetical protein
MKFTLEHRKNLSLAHKGQIPKNLSMLHTEEIRKKISNTRKGQPSPNKGKKFSQEHKEKLSLARKGIKLSLETRRRISEGHRGNKSYLWKGGITPINRVIRHSFEYKLWRKAIFERDNYSCIWCGARNGNGKAIILHADHIKPFALFPELRFAIDNGRTLCKDCHAKTDTYKKKKI